MLGPKRMRFNDLMRYPRKFAMGVEGDRLSHLPDDLIHKIFAFISIKDAIGTSVLSTRWRFIWTSMPYLNFENFNDRSNISEFISNVFSHRNNHIQVSSLNLLLGKQVRDNESATSILNYAFSHNVEQLSVKREQHVPIIMFTYSFIATPTLDLPFLTTLHLHNVKLSDDNGGLFSKCTNLKNLSLKRCGLKGTKVLNICHPRLSNLTLEYTPHDSFILSPSVVDEVVNVVAPQLKNLTTKECEGEHLINAPGLTSLVIDGFNPRLLSIQADFHSLEKVSLYMYEREKADAHEIAYLLQQLHSVKRLTLNLGILKRLFSIKTPSKFYYIKQRTTKSARLSSAMELSQHKACAFANTKILKFIPNIARVHLEVRAQEKVTTSSEIKNYDTSPSSIFPMVSREEIMAMVDMKSAAGFVKHLGYFLINLKANTNSNTNKAHNGKPQVEMHWARELQRNLGKITILLQLRKIVALENCGMMAGLRQRYISRLETHPMITWFQEMRELFERIERLITQLSALKRVVLQPIFISCCEDAAILTNNMLGWMKTAKYRDIHALII